MIFQTMALEIMIILFLFVVNGFLSLSEMAIVSSRKIRLRRLADAGRPGAKTALDLINSPSDFLAAIQIGITLTGVLVGAFSGATIAAEVGDLMKALPIIGPYSGTIGLGLVVLVVTFLSLVIGELVPKRLALNNAERIALSVAKPVKMLSVIAYPAVRILTITTEKFLKLIGASSSKEPPITEEEVEILVEQGAKAGVFERAEESMIKRIFAFGDRRVGELMTQRIQIVALDVDASFEKNLKKMMDTSHSYFPIYKHTKDNLIGLVSIKCVLACMAKAKEVDLNQCIVKPLIVAETMPMLALLELFKRSGKHLALVVDEYGSTAGLITLVDVIEAIVGDIEDKEDLLSSRSVERDDGSWLIDGIVPVYEYSEMLGLQKQATYRAGDFQTLGGFVTTKLAHIPKVGESFIWEGYKFEVVDMDGYRVDKVLVTPLPSRRF